MNAIRPRPILLPDRRLFRALIALTILTGVACRRSEPPLALHYLPGFVPGTRDVFAPAQIAIAPPSGLAAQSRIEAGAVFNPDGKAEQRLFVSDFAGLLAESIARGLKDAGLGTVVLDATPVDHKPPDGAAFLLIAQLEELHVNKRFGPETSVHGRYFTMHSHVKLGIQLFDHAGRERYSGAVSGVEDEPPAPVGNEVFLPLETEPGESLSVALSRAIGAIVLEPGIRRVLSARGSS